MKKQTNCKCSKTVVASKERKGSVLYKSVQKSLQFGNSVSKLRHTSESSISHNTLFLNSWTFNIRTRISICPWIQVKNTNKWSQYWYNTRRQELRDKTIQNKYTDLESKVWHEIRLVLQRLVCWPFYSRSPAVCWWEGPSVVKGSVSVCVCVCLGKGKADELHFLLAADGACRLGGQSIGWRTRVSEKNEGPFAFYLSGRKERRGA